MEFILFVKIKDKSLKYKITINMQDQMQVSYAVHFNQLTRAGTSFQNRTIMSLLQFLIGCKTFCYMTFYCVGQGGYTIYFKQKNITVLKTYLGKKAL